MKHVKGIIFDLDGTLLDTMGYWHSLGEHYLTGRGIRNIPKGLYELLGPTDMMHSACWLKERFDLPEPPETIIRDIEAMLEVQYRNHFMVKPGTVDFLKEVSGSGRYQICLATATARHLVLPALERNGIDHHFEFILTTKEIGVEKHRPEIFLEACRRFGLTPKETVVFEDAHYAILTAHQAGFPVVAVADREERHHELEIRQMADVYVEQIGDAASLFL